jgi:hypothetical protein
LSTSQAIEEQADGVENTDLLLRGKFDTMNFDNKCESSVSNSIPPVTIISYSDEGGEATLTAEGDDPIPKRVSVRREEGKNRVQQSQGNSGT